jgi:hypothetical protein
MNTGAAHITYEDNDVVVVDGVTIQKFKQGRINSYKPEQIKAAGGLDAFAKMVGYNGPSKMPDFAFSSDELKAIDDALEEERKLNATGHNA